MIYLKWKLSGGTCGSGPERKISQRGGTAEGSWALDGVYHLGYLTETAPLTGLDEPWDVSEQTEAEALAFCQELYADAEVLADGTISGPVWEHPDE